MFFSSLNRIGREFGQNLVNLDILTVKVFLLEPKIDVVPNFIANNIFFSLFTCPKILRSSRSGNERFGLAVAVAERGPVPSIFNA